LNRFEPYLPLLQNALRRLDTWRSAYGEAKHETAHDAAEINKILARLEERLQGNYPFHHPQYAGQMLKPPHPVAWLAQALTATINPNNHALDGGPPTSEMEKECVDELAAMCGYQKPWLGHLSSAGTIANLEALFVAREIHPGKAIAATANAHYTHSRMCRVLNTPFIEVPVNAAGDPDMDFLGQHAKEIGTLVVTMGTTGLGNVEPLRRLIGWASGNDIRIHADAAYGGFFKIIANELGSEEDWDHLHLADSIVIDPHKHGLQPYGCGSILFRDPAAGRFYKHDSPYTYFTSDDLHLGEISLECSRAGASAAAFWATLQLLPLNRKGLGSILLSARNAALNFSELVDQSSDFSLYARPDLDIVGYFKVPDKKKLSEVSRLSRKIFDEGMNRKENGFYLSLFVVPANHFAQKFPGYKTDAESVTILRSVFMKEEHESFVEELASRIGI
jgi:glutamate/tyrosine decarboxylase-like PLP-dependent enzyme